MILDFLTVFAATYFFELPAQQDQSNLIGSASNATSGCGLVPTWQFNTSDHANVTVGDRSFLVHIPVSYDVTTPHAVVLSFHAFKQNDLKQEKLSGFSEKGLELNGKVIANRSLSELIIDKIFRASLQVRYRPIIAYLPID